MSALDRLVGASLGLRESRVRLPRRRRSAARVLAVAGPLLVAVGEGGPVGGVAPFGGGAAPPDDVFAAITGEAGKLLPADVTHLNRYEPDGTVTIVGSWSTAGGSIPVGTRLALGGTDLSTRV